MDGVTHRFVDAGGLRVHVAEAGDPDAPAVLMLHGWPQHWYMWRRLLAALRGEWRLLAPDLRGFGWTEAPRTAYGPETFARDQIELLDALGIERVLLVGHDWGGFTGFVLGLRHPDRVDGFLALNTPHPWPPLTARVALAQLPRGWYALVNAAPGLGPALHRAGLVRLGLRAAAAAGTFSEQELELYAGRLRERERARAMSALYRSYLSSGARLVRGGPYAKLRLAVPTRLVFGARDLALSTRLLAGFEPHADQMELELVPDAGHFIVDERPELVIERTRAMLAAPPAA